MSIRSLLRLTTPAILLACSLAASAATAPTVSPAPLVIERADNYSYQLSEGVIVQFTGIAPSVTADDPLPATRMWWMPNGFPMHSACSDVPGLRACSHNDPGEVYREFVFYVNDTRKRQSPITSEVVVPSEVAATDNVLGVEKRGSLRHVTTLPAGTKNCDVYLGLAAGEWQDIAVCKGTQGGSILTDGSGTILFSEAYQIPGATLLPVSDNLFSNVALTDTVNVHSRDFRIVAVTTTGQVVPADRLRSGGASAEFRLSTAVFPKLAVTSIKEFRAQVRPFHWILFPHVIVGPNLPPPAMTERPGITASR